MIRQVDMRTFRMRVPAALAHRLVGEHCERSGSSSLIEFWRALVFPPMENDRQIGSGVTAVLNPLVVSVSVIPL